MEINYVILSLNNVARDVVLVLSKDEIPYIKFDINKKENFVMIYENDSDFFQNILNNYSGFELKEIKIEYENQSINVDFSNAEIISMAQHFGKDFVFIGSQKDYDKFLGV